MLMTEKKRPAYRTLRGWATNRLAFTIISSACCPAQSDQRIILVRIDHEHVRSRLGTIIRRESHWQSDVLRNQLH
jgi:hypothetical protein